jgi:dienelactone hydrolase
VTAVAEAVVFHHALGLTDAVRRFADALRDAGHTVHSPDLYYGRTFDTVEDGMARDIPERWPTSPCLGGNEVKEARCPASCARRNHCPQTHATADT